MPDLLGPKRSPAGKAGGADNGVAVGQARFFSFVFRITCSAMANGTVS